MAMLLLYLIVAAANDLHSARSLGGEVWALVLQERGFEFPQVAPNQWG